MVYYNYYYFSVNKDLWQAARQGNIELIREALDNGADISCKLNKGQIKQLCHDNCSPLLVASSHGHSLAVEYLLLRGSSIEETNKLDSNGLHLASCQGHHDVLAVLLDYGADVNRVNVNGLTPLHNASRYGRVSSVKLILERGADTSAKNGQCLTALEMAGCYNKSQKEAVERVFHEFKKC